MVEAESMARIRTIKPEFWKHEDLSSLSEATHMLAAALLNYSDDEGYFNANPKLVQAECCPLREPSVSVPESLRELARIGFIKLGTGGDGKRYGLIVTFCDHQYINRPTPSKIKELGIVWEDSVTPHGALTEPSRLERKGKEQGKEGNREGNSAREARSTPAPDEAKSNGKGTRLPDAWGITQELFEWAQENFPQVNVSVEEDKFIDYFRARAGQNAIKRDWNAAFRNWIRKAAEYANQRTH